MNIYWYWPHPHRNASQLALSTMRDGDSLTVQALPSLRGEAFLDISEYEVVRDLPDPTSAALGRGRIARPVRLALGRSAARRRLLKRGFDVAHIELLTYQTDWIDLAWIGRSTPMVANVHDVRPHRSTMPGSIEGALLRATYRHPRCLVVYHQALADELVADFRVEPGRVAVIPHPLDATEPVRSKSTTADRPIVLLFGALRANKGIDEFITAARLLAGTVEADFVIAGAGDTVIQKKIARAVETIGPLNAELGYVPPERKSHLFESAACIVLPYTSFHSQSGVLADAYRYRIPLVVTDVGAIGPTVREDGTGVVVRPNDAPALAAGISEVLARRDRPVFAALLDAAASKHDHRVVGAQLRRLYDTVTQG
jgi:glycosyltransferase involved in cell wall biosynthesis